jgi:hypothetical protein
MKHTIIKNAIPLEVCSYIKDFFEKRMDLYDERQNQIRIHQPWLHLKHILEPYLTKYIKVLNDQGGNIYKHNYDYGPHVDSSESYQMINCLIPIYIHEPSDDKQRFVVFDQYVDNGFGRTWKCRPWKTEVDLTYNKKTELCPYQDNLVYDKIEGMDMEFYKKYLDHNHAWPDMYMGLTGTAYEAIPGNLILFNSNQIHTSGKINCAWKIGLFINFAGSLQELLIQ